MMTVESVQALILDLDGDWSDSLEVGVSVTVGGIGSTSGSVDLTLENEETGERKSFLVRIDEAEEGSPTDGDDWLSGATCNPDDPEDCESCQ